MFPTTSSGVRAAPSATGTLGGIPLAHALVHIRNKRLAGVLELRASSKRHAWVVFWKGLVVSIMTTPTMARFGTVVYEMGLIDALTLDASTRQSRDTNRPQMDVLLGRGAITKADCDLVMAEQVRRRVHHLFTFPPTTTFTFREGSTSNAANPEPAVLVDLLAPVWRGLRDFPPDVRTSDVLERIASHTLSLVSETVLERAQLSEEETLTCELLAKNALTLAELRSASPLPRDHVDLLVYFLLITRGVEVRALGRPAVASSALWTAVRPPIRARGPTETKVAADASDDLSRLDTPFAPISAVPRVSSDRLTAVGASKVAVPIVRTPSELGADAIERRAAQLDHETPYSLLGLPEGASAEAARAAFFRLSRSWNPTKLPAELDHVRPAVERIFTHMSEAHRLLTDPHHPFFAMTAGGR